MKKHRCLSIVIAVVMMAVMLVACGNADDSGKSGAAKKLVSTAADITEIIDGLGHAGEIVAADTYSYGVGSVDPQVCILDYASPDIEAIIALEPDCIFVSSSSTDGTNSPYEALVELGVNVVYIPTATSIHGIKDNIAAIAKELGEDKKAEELVKSIDTAVDKAKKRAEGKEEVSVYFEISAAPWLYTFGSGTYLDEIITICGGSNIYSDSNGWISNNDESVVAADPQVIITNVMYDGYDYNEIAERAGWDVISAVKNARIYQVDANASSRGSQNIVKAIEEVSKAIISDEN